MVNLISHFGLGLFIASATGYKNRREKWIIGIMAIVPDLDGITTILFLMLDWAGLVPSGHYRLLFFIMMHRELGHYALFMLVPTAILWFREGKNSKLTAVGAIALLTHLFIDTASWWGMRSLWPVTSAGLSLGIIDYSDPIVNLLTLAIVAIFLFNGSHRLGKRYPKAREYFERNEDFISVRFLTVVVVWLILAVVLKAAMIHAVEQDEGADIGFLDTGGQAGFGRAYTAYDHNETHFRALRISYWGGVDEGVYIPKLTVNTSSSASPMDNDFRSRYVNRSFDLYDNSLLQELEFIVVVVKETNTSIEIILSDARAAVAGDGASWFKASYRFMYNINETIDDIEDADFTAFRTMFEMGGEEDEVPREWFI